MRPTQLSASPAPGQQRALSLFFPPLQCSWGIPCPSHSASLPQNTGPQAKEIPAPLITSTPNHIRGHPGETRLSHAHRAGSVCCLQSHSLNCRALRYNPIIHASLIKAVNCPIVKMQNAQHLLSGNPLPGVREACQRVHQSNSQSQCLPFKLVSLVPGI